jgi:hypothetical protein
MTMKGKIGLKEKNHPSYRLGPRGDQGASSIGTISPSQTAAK